MSHNPGPISMENWTRDDTGDPTTRDRKYETRCLDYKNSLLGDELDTRKNSTSSRTTRLQRDKIGCPRTRLEQGTRQELELELEEYLLDGHDSLSSQDWGLIATPRTHIIQFPALHLHVYSSGFPSESQAPSEVSKFLRNWRNLSEHGNICQINLCVLQLLRQYLGEYVHGLSAEALKISVWQGNVVLKDLQLKAEALNSLKLPVTVKAGFLGSVTLKVPWNRLGNESVIVLLDRIFIVAEPIQDDQISEEDRKDRLLEAKRRQLDATESAMLEAKEKRRQQEKNIKETTSWITSLITTIIGNLKISITNVHIRYEDCTSNPGKPFCCGVTLSKLAAVTIDENGKETFVTSGALDKLHKSIQLEQLAFYHDSNSSPWKLGKSYSEMTRQEWCEVFEATINQKHPQVSPLLSTVSKSKYLLRPINGVLNYYQYGRREKRDIHTPLQSLSLVLDDVSLTVSENQYCDGLKLLEGISQYRKRIEFSHFRPWVTVHDDPRTWWMYASRARLKQQNKARSHLSWERVSHMCSLRRRYVELYLEKLQGKPMAENVQMKEIEEIVDIEVLLIWRLLAHAKVKTVKLKEANLQSDKSKSGWWGFRWSKSAADKADGSPESTTPKEERELGDFTKQEWDKINEFLSDPAGEEASLFTDQDSSCTLLKAVNATIRKSAITIFDKSDVEILCGCFSALSVVTNLYPSMLECTLKLQSYGLSAPEGSLIKSVLIKDNEQALTASYVRNPLNSPLDWKVSATILPCYVTVWFASFKRFMQFLQSTNAVSPDVASETATVLQNKLEKVRRRAQEQLRLALEEECKFSIHLDLDAPKVRIPAGNSELYRDQRSQLVLDLGHFTLDSDNKEKEYKLATNKQALENIYSRFYISGNDIAAYLVSGTCEWESIQELLSKDGIEVSLNHVSSMCSRSPIILPVIDRCRMYLLFEQLRIPDPAYPSTHIALQVPRLGLHFSPGRYRSLLQLIEGLDPSCTSNKLDSSDLSHIKASWYPADYEGSGMVLVWKGLGNAVAEWQPCWCVLSGSYFYILEAANSRSYQRCCSLNGKQILEVPSSSIGGSEHVLAVCARGMELQKCLEASSSIIIKLTDLESRDGWQTALMATVSRLSSPLSMLIPEEGTSKDIKAKAGDFLDQPVLFVSGGLHELQLSLYATVNEDLITKEEFLLLSLRAGGGEVNVLQQQYDSIISTYLRYLRIEDRLKDPVGSNGQCIARSIINRSSSYSSVGQDEEDTFDDAMDEFGGPLDLSTESRLTHKCGEETEMEGQDIAYSKGDFEAFGLKDLKLAPGETILNKMFLNVNEATGNFVTMLFEMRQFESSNYDGTDVKMSISMATLEFFCNRPTVVALIDFGSEISAIGEEQSGPKSTNEVAGRIPEVSNKNDIVKGLLGQGKSRTVFHLIMSMDSVRVFLNLENGRQLAMLDKEGFHMNLRVFPGTFGINITLGNLRIRDLTLDSNHHWAWICDLRDPSSGSLVKFEFQSFNVDEEDYKGYDYSLSGKLSSVHLVFLYRFIQEVIAYFAALSAPHTQSLTRVVDKVGGIEVLVPQSDIDGLPALKLDVHLVSPIITVPGGSDSKDFMRLDMGYLKLSNAFEWCGGSKYDDSAVHLDVLSAEISGINLVVGVGGIEGKPMIQDAQGISVRVCRPLRDLFKRTPMVQVDVQFKSLKGILSDREYLVITGCAASNIAEMPDLPPDFRDIGSYTEDIGRTQVISGLREDTQCEETKTSRENRTWTTARVNVEIQNVVLELQNGFEREVALARMEMEGLWLNYRSTSLQEITVLLTLPRLCLLDLRPNTKPEMRLMLGSMADAESDVLYNMLSTELRAANTQPPMLVMDTKLKLDSQAFIIRIQRPRILVVLDFIISVSKFFVPSLAAVTHKDKELDPEHDPLGLQQHLRLTTAHFKQEATVMTFSTKKRLIVDYPGIDVFTYDGCGNTMVLDIDDTKISSVPIAEPIIIVSAGKALNFKNIKIKVLIILFWKLEGGEGGREKERKKESVFTSIRRPNSAYETNRCTWVYLLSIREYKSAEKETGKADTYLREMRVEIPMKGGVYGVRYLWQSICKGVVQQAWECI
ncbi:hypothetical protein KP509_09G071400 [Ceratopteris richardii]|uniref:PH domain-containing protein n=1 Tax=Ceratopteris richardii TaxID=49495 RepID=A0A8T2UBR3_CERRI|nr:hypothetical protein KP509_09G071400 [Ceratopteris richardii]